MFRIPPPTRRSALLRSRSDFCRARLFHSTSSAKGRPGPHKFDFSQLSEIPESAKGLSKHLHNVYTSSGSMKRAQADNKRVNVVSRALCDDIIERMKPSLLKHTGCDIIDINPGAGVWSSAVHNLLKPRNHYLMEPDHELYTPLLQPLLDAEDSTYKLIPKSGAVWGQLTNLLSPANLPQQMEYKAGDPRLDNPNDTLLVIANLGWHPRRPFRAFPSVSLLVIHQLLSAVRAHSLFHRYGLVRMLVWLADDEGKQVLPRNISARRKMAIEAEISCNGIYEIAASTVESAAWRRDEYINVESSRRVLKKMEEAGITTPKGREGLYQLQATKGPQEQNPEDERISIRRKWQDELQELQKQFAAGKFSEYVDIDAPPEKKPRIVVNPEWKRLRTLKRWVELQKKQGITPTAKGSRLAELKKLEAKFEAGGISEFVDIDAVPPPQEKGQRLVLNPEWKRIQGMRWRIEKRKKEGKTTTEKTLANLNELEAMFEAGGGHQYLVPDPNLHSINEETADAVNSKQTNQAPKPKEKKLRGKNMDEVLSPKGRRPRGTKNTEEFRRMKDLEGRIISDHNNAERAVPLFAEFETILEMQKTVQALEGPEGEELQRDIDERTAGFNEAIETLSRNSGDTFRHRLDNRRTFKNEPPILYWDRREAEPLQVRPDEFYPEHELCLLDFHPAPLWPVLRQDFPATYDVFEYILSTMFMTPTQSVKSALTAASPGALEWLVAECSSLTDISKGGNPDLDFMTVRCLTLEMFKEIMEAWMKWPFRPDRYELMKKSGSAAYDPDEEALE